MTVARASLCFVVEVRGRAAAEAILGVLEDYAAAISAFETGPGAWRIEAYPRAPLLAPALTARLSLVAAVNGGVLVSVAERFLPECDWATLNRLSFPPIRIGRFLVYGSHHRRRVPGGMIGIMIDAAAAFGTGEHPSTRGCLEAFVALAQRRRFRRPLDIGTGTGILAIAAAKMLRRPVVARDLDPGAVRIASVNANWNAVAPLLRIAAAPGYRGRDLRRRRYDLVFANILAAPLALMAVDLARTLAPGGRAIVSGLLRRQEPLVLTPHRGRGLVLERRRVIDGWSTLILRPPRRYR
jgi:ribosomal protein L11 methyltransferase